MVNKQLIAQTDSVTLDCQAPHYQSVFQCYFDIMGESTIGFTCMKTLTASELLLRSRQIPPVVVQLKCFYTLKYENLNSPSAHSNIISITILGRSLG